MKRIISFDVLKIADRMIFFSRSARIQFALARMKNPFPWQPGGNHIKNISLIFLNFSNFSSIFLQKLNMSSKTNFVLEN
jgi:hypothetical protein